MAEPEQLFNVGITAILPVILLPEEFEPALKEGILLLPDAARPIAVLLLVQANEAPAGTLTKFPMLTNEPGHTKTLDIVLAEGVGLIVTVKLKGEPGQPLREGVTDIVPTILAPTLEGAVHELMLPLPLEPKPIAVFELAHVKEAPAGVLAKAGIDMVSPGHTVIFDMAFTDGSVLIVRVTVVERLRQPFSV